MSRVLTRSFGAVLLLTVLVPAAHAGGINLSWNDCGSFGVAQKSFACGSNLGTDLLFPSAIPSASIAELDGAECALTIQTPAATLPDWWQRQPGGCEANGLPVAFVFTPLTSCGDPWAAGAASGGIVFDPPGSDLHCRAFTVIPDGTGVPANTSSELYLVRLNLSHQKSVGAGSCAGCTQSACIVLTSVKLYGPSGVLVQTLTNPLLRQHVIWQDPALLVGCPGATPAHAPTWGEVKSLYR